MDALDHMFGRKASGPWEDWFAWYPVKTVYGERIWFKKVLRRFKFRRKLVERFGKGWYVNKKFYEYATSFDVLKGGPLIDPPMDPEFAEVIIPLIRKVMPGVIASQIVGVQPMQGPIGQTHTMKIKLNQNNNQNNNNQTP